MDYGIIEILESEKKSKHFSIWTNHFNESPISVEEERDREGKFKMIETTQLFWFSFRFQANSPGTDSYADLRSLFRLAITKDDLPVVVTHSTLLVLLESENRIQYPICFGSKLDSNQTTIFL